MQKALKILFVCSSLEPGRDGVGDYTRRLAGELATRGHTCSLLALADPHVDAATQIAIPIDGTDHSLSCLRLPATEPWAQRVHQAAAFRQKAAPDWISWQLVLYGFDPRGLSFGLGQRLREIGGGVRSQVMFHEIWIGESNASPLKNRVIGTLQRSIIRGVLRQLQPAVVNTHTPLYQFLLARLGHPVSRLPLFGNIPVTAHPRADWLQEKWPQHSADFAGRHRADWWIFIMFGSIHPEWDEADFVRQATARAEAAGKKCALISVGRMGAAGEEKWRRLQKLESGSWHFLNLGPQAEDDVSQCLLIGDYGVSAVPPENLYKSGAATAMLEHGLGVIATRPMAQYRHCPPDQLMAGLDNAVLDFNLEMLKKTKPGSLLPAVATQFLRELETA